MRLTTSVVGTTRTSRHVRAMSVIEGTSEVKYSLRVFRLLTQLRFSSARPVRL
jgi:hypothetical protein